MKTRDFEKEFEEKYEKYGNILYRIAFLYLNNAADSEDVLQDVFMKYLTYRKRFSSAEHERAWFIRVTQNCCLDMLRKAERKNTDIDNVSVAASDLDNDLEQDIRECVFSLPPKLKSAVFLYYYCGCSVEEIAGILKVSRAAVKKRLQRGREILKIDLEDYAP